MAKRKLLQWMRDQLIRYAHEKVDPVSERKAMDAAYKKVAPLVIKVVQAKYKPADMKILQKYGVANEDTCIRLTLPDSRVVKCDLRDKDAVLVPSGYCSGRMYLADAALMKAYDVFVKAQEMHKDETEKRIAAYVALVRQAGYVEDVVAIWPEVESLLPQTAVMAPLTQDQLAIIERDQKQRIAA